MSIREPKMVGLRFGRLAVESVAREAAWGGFHWFAYCRCDCGNPVRVQVGNLRSGNTASCGCLQRERSSETLASMRRTHGEGHRKLYHVWYGVKRRCYSPKDISYCRYGGRGIRVCDEWQRYEAFRDWALANGYREGLSIERIDFNGNYEPSNCTWISNTLQARNTRRNRYVEAFGERKLVADWMKDPRCVVDHARLHYRLKAGWPAELALTAPSYSVYRRKDARRV